MDKSLAISIVLLKDPLPTFTSSTKDERPLAIFFERIDETQITKKELINKFMVEVNRLNDLGVNVTHEVYEKNELYTIGSYRRDLNYKNCNEYDFVVWGESDCLIPKEFFTTLETVSNYTDENNIHLKS